MNPPVLRIPAVGLIEVGLKELHYSGMAEPDLFFISFFFFCAKYLSRTNFKVNGQKCIFVQ